MVGELQLQEAQVRPCLCSVSAHFDPADFTPCTLPLVPQGNELVQMAGFSQSTGLVGWGGIHISRSIQLHLASIPSAKRFYFVFLGWIDSNEVQCVLRLLFLFLCSTLFLSVKPNAVFPADSGSNAVKIMVIRVDG